MDRVSIDLTENQKLFFTSDLHFQHKNILAFCHRPYETVKDMENGLISNWNNVVNNDDIVFLLGDVCWFKSRHECKKLLNKLNGKEIHILLGNHDVLKTFELLDDRFIIHSDVVNLYVRTQSNTVYELYLSHLPLATFPHKVRQRVYHFYGHIHSGPLCENKIDILGKDLIMLPNTYDVGVDNNNYTPIALEEIIEKLGPLDTVDVELTDYNEYN